MESHSNRTRGYAIALLSAAILSTTAIFIRQLTQAYHMPALVLAFWREIFVAVTLIIFLGLIRPVMLTVQHRHIPYLIAYGFVLAIFNSLWTLSVAINGAAISTVLVYSSAAFTALLGWWLLKERVDRYKILAVIVSLIGCALVSDAINASAWQANLLGIITGIASGLGYAAYSLMGRSAAQRGLNPWTTLLYTFGFASMFLFTINLVSGGSRPGSATRPSDFMWLGNSIPGWTVLIILAAVPTLLGYGTYNVSLVYLPSSVVNLIATLEPVFTAVIAFLVFGELLNVVQILGSLMIMSAVVLLRMHENAIGLE
jgi:drug/metabolite transporter (DMT)-like permease